MTKKNLRKQYIKERRGLTKDVISRKSDLIQRKAIEFIRNHDAKVIMSYVDYQNEVITKQIHQFCLFHHIVVLLPKIQDQKMSFTLLENLNDSLVKSSDYKFLESKSSKTIVYSDVDLWFIPGIVFSKEGYRIGYGHGFYDYFFLSYPFIRNKIGLSFDFQMINSLPVDKHDIKLDYIITESQILKIDEFSSNL